MWEGYLKSIQNGFITILFSNTNFPQKLQRKTFNSLPNDNFLEWFKLKAFADDKIKVAEKMKIGLGGIENIVVTSIFSLSHNGF